MSMIQGWTVYCAGGETEPQCYCYAINRLNGSKRRVADKFRSSGWRCVRRDRKTVWLCPECANEQATRPLQKLKAQDEKPTRRRLG